MDSGRPTPNAFPDSRIAQLRDDLRQTLTGRRFSIDPSWARMMCSIVRYAMYRDVTQAYARHILQIAYDRSIYEMWPTMAIPLELLLKNQGT